jgi:hypothetical protein
MPITATLDGIPYTLHTEDDVVTFHRALRRLVGEPRTSKPAATTSPESTRSNGLDPDAVRRFFTALRNAPTGATPIDIAHALRLPAAKSLAPYINVVRKTLTSVGQDYDKLVTKTRPGRRGANGRRDSIYRMTDDGKKVIDELVK